MRFSILASVALLALTACAPGIPDSGSGIGFDSYDRDRRAAVDAELQGRPVTLPTTVQPPVRGATLDSSGAIQRGPAPAPAPATASAPASAGSGTTDVADLAARALARDTNSGQAPVQASPGNPAPQVVANAAGISGEQDFGAVSDERSIEQDAALIAQNRARYQVIQPGAVPQRQGNEGPNIVAYALQTTNVVGQPLYRRSAFASKDKEARNCRGYASDDLAQEAFLAAGGPEKDREGLDADGDGFACRWDPSPFRAVRGN